MIVEILKEEMAKLLRVLSGGVDRKNINPVLSNILISVDDEYLTGVSSDLDIEIKSRAPLAKVIKSGSVTIPFRKINDIVRAVSGAVLTIESKKDRCFIKSDRSVFTLCTVDSEKFPLMPESKKLDNNLDISINNEKLKFLLEKAHFAMADQDVRYFLNGMLLEGSGKLLTAVAADGHRLAVNKIAVENHDMSFRIIIPRKGVLEVMKFISDSEENSTIFIGSGYISLLSASGSLKIKLLEGKFPDYERIIPINNKHVVVGKRESLKEVFQRASALFSEKFRAIKLNISNNVIKVVANNNEHDRVEEDLEVDYCGEDIEVGFNAKYLLDYLSVSSSEEVRITFGDAYSSTLIEDVDSGCGAYILMPIKT